MAKKKKSYVLLCNHCGNKSTQSVLFEHTITIELTAIGGGPLYPMSYFYILTKCETCGEVSFYGIDEFTAEEQGSDLSNAYLHYPKSDELSVVVPKNVRKTYAEASRIKKLSPNGYAVLIRRALEAICKDQKAKGNNLVKKLEYLSNKNILPPTLAKTGTVLRNIGNIGAHATDSDVSTSDVNTMDDFFKFMIEYIYVAPAKLAKIQKKK